MFRPLFAAAALLMLAPIAFADDKAPRDARVEEALKGLPSEAEIDTALAALPDMNALMTSMEDVMKDPETKATVDRFVARLEDRVGKEGLGKTENGRPDVNALMREMLQLTSDREFMAEMIGLAFTMQDAMEEALPEAPAETPAK